MNNPLNEPLVCIRIREAEKLQVMLRSYLQEIPRIELPKKRADAIAMLNYIRALTDDAKNKKDAMEAAK